MDPLSLGLIALRSLATLFSLQGQVGQSNAFLALADAAESGIDIDNHLAIVAAALKEGTLGQEDWDDVTARIRGETDEFLARGPDTGGFAPEPE